MTISPEELKIISDTNSEALTEALSENARLKQSNIQYHDENVILRTKINSRLYSAKEAIQDAPGHALVSVFILFLCAIVCYPAWMALFHCTSTCEYYINTQFCKSGVAIYQIINWGQDRKVSPCIKYEDALPLEEALHKKCVERRPK